VQSKMRNNPANALTNRSRSRSRDSCKEEGDYEVESLLDNRTDAAQSFNCARNPRRVAGVFALCFLTVVVLVWILQSTIPVDNSSIARSPSMPNKNHEKTKEAMVQTAGGHPESKNNSTASPSEITKEAIEQMAKTGLPVSSSSSSPSIRPLLPLAQVQAANYRNHTGIVLNLHITHHGGTTFCGAFSGSPDAVGSVPSYSCWKVKSEDNVTTEYPHFNPWSHTMTARNVAIVRQYFHMISWEYKKPPNPPIFWTNWEDENIFSVIIMRDPMSRMVAGDGYLSKYYDGVTDGTANYSVLHKFAYSDYTDNFALRVLTGNGCCSGNHTDRKHLEAAKDLIRRFSVVIDIKCLTETLELLATNEWNITLRRSIKKVRTKPPPREAIWDNEIYEYLREKNKLDVELYEWSKSLSYLDCSQV
jgi:hypothetical protein